MIYDISPVNKYNGNNSSTQFDFDFYIENSAQLNVYHYNSNGEKNKLTYNVDYSIHEFKNPNGSYIIFPIENSTYGVLAQGEEISLELTLPISQETAYNNSSLLNLEALEYSFDYLTRLIQILSGRLNRCLELGDYTSSDITNLIQQVINCASKAQTAYENIRQYGFEKATTQSPGVVQIGTGINIDSNGIISTEEGSDKNINNLSTLGNARLQYAPFSINAGTVENGENNTLTYSSEIITCSPCTITTADGRTKVFSASAVYDVSEENDGDYSVFKNYSDGSLSLMSNFATAKTNPSHFNYNITEVGTLTKNNGVISDFSSSNYATLPVNPLSAIANANNFELVVSFTTGGNVSTEQAVFFQGLSNENYGYNAFGITVYNSKFYYIYSYNSSNQAIAGTHSIQANTAYIAKLEFTGTAVNAYYSTDNGETFILDATKSTSVKLSTSAYNCSIGIRLNPSTQLPFYGSVNLEDSYIKIDNEYFWKGSEFVIPNWLDISTIPANLKVYDSTNDVWNVNNDLIYIGDCTIANGAVTALENREFNNSGYLIEKSVTNAVIPDYTAGVSIGLRLSGNPYTAPKEGIIIVNNNNRNQSSTTSYLVVNGTQTNCNIGCASEYTTTNSLIAMVGKDDACYFTNSIPVNSVYFYPLKGAN